MPVFFAFGILLERGVPDALLPEPTFFAGGVLKRAEEAMRTKRGWETPEASNQLLGWRSISLAKNG